MQSATGEKPKMWGPSIIGFGSYHYTYESGREGDMPIVGFSPRKAAIVFYLGLGAGGSEKTAGQAGQAHYGQGLSLHQEARGRRSKGVGEPGGKECGGAAGEIEALLNPYSRQYRHPAVKIPSHTGRALS